MDAEGDALVFSNSTANIVDSVVTNNGDLSFPLPYGGMYVIRASLVRTEGVMFSYNGQADPFTTEDVRYGVWLKGPETRMYTDDAVNVLDASRGQKLPLADAPEGPFLTGPPA